MIGLFSNSLFLIPPGFWCWLHVWSTKTNTFRLRAHCMQLIYMYLTCTCIWASSMHVTPHCNSTQLEHSIKHSMEHNTMKNFVAVYFLGFVCPRNSFNRSKVNVSQKRRLIDKRVMLVATTPIQPLLLCTPIQLHNLLVYNLHTSRVSTLQLCCILLVELLDLS